MNEESDQPSRVPEFNAMALLQQRLAQKAAGGAANQSAHPKGPFDPYQSMLNRKAQNAGEATDDYPTQTWPEEDIKRLQDFCQQRGIVGFNCGTMGPVVALALLKQKLGIVDQFPKSEGYGPNYPYGEAIKRKMLLKG